MQVVFSRSAFRQFSKLEKSVQQRIMGKLQFYARQKNVLRFAERLTHLSFGGWRFRVGEYRILFDVDRGILAVLKIGHRRDVYK